MNAPKVGGSFAPACGTLALALIGLALALLVFSGAVTVALHLLHERPLFVSSWGGSLPSPAAMIEGMQIVGRTVVGLAAVSFVLMLFMSNSD